MKAPTLMTAKDTIEALNTQLVTLGDGSMTYTDNPVLSGLKGDTDGLVVPNYDVQGGVWKR